jgi:hypothetical protein
MSDNARNTLLVLICMNTGDSAESPVIIRYWDSLRKIYSCTRVYYSTKFSSTRISSHARAYCMSSEIRRFRSIGDDPGPGALCTVPLLYFVVKLYLFYFQIL